MLTFHFAYYSKNTCVQWTSPDCLQVQVDRRPQNRDSPPFASEVRCCSKPTFVAIQIRGSPPPFEFEACRNSNLKIVTAIRIRGSQPFKFEDCRQPSNPRITNVRHLSYSRFISAVRNEQLMIFDCPFKYTYCC